jgi:hypothetical protein
MGNDMDEPNIDRAVILVCSGAIATYLAGSIRQIDVKDYNYN